MLVLPVIWLGGLVSLQFAAPGKPSLLAPLGLCAVGVELGIAARAVSYTHLDVYKRQTESHPGRGRAQRTHSEPKRTTRATAAAKSAIPIAATAADANSESANPTPTSASAPYS